MPVKVCGASAKELGEVHETLRETFARDAEPGAVKPFYIACDVSDPDYRPEQYRFRRFRGRVVSALKVYVRRLHHPNGPVPVTVIGGVCTRQEYRGRGMIGPVMQDSLEYSRSLGAKAELIVTPRPDYYLRHGFAYAKTYERTARIPELPLRNGRVEPLRPEDAGWVTDMFNAAAQGYGPVIRTEEYTRKWVIGMKLTKPDCLGFKLLRRGRPVAYGAFSFNGDRIHVMEIASRKRNGVEESALLSVCGPLGRQRFVAHFPREHPLIAHLSQSGTRVGRKPIQRYMYYPLDPSFPIPDEHFEYSRLDFV